MSEYTYANPRIKNFKMGEEQILTNDIIKDLINKHKMEILPLLEENEDFLYQDNLPIEEHFKEEEDAGSFNGVRLKNNIPNVIVNTHLSYVIGNGISFESDETEKDSLDEFLKIRTDNYLDDKEKDLMEYMGRYGVGYELVYYDDNEIQVDTVNPKECFIVDDYSIKEKPLYGFRYYLDYNKNTIVEIYGKKENAKVKIMKSTGEIVLIYKKENIYNEVQLIQYKNNDFMHSDFQPVKRYLEDLNKTMTSESDLIHYMASATIVFENILVDEESVRLMIINKNIMTKSDENSNGGRVYFLEKPLNVDGIKQHYDMLRNNIFLESFTPFLSMQQLTKAPSGKALQTLYLNAGIIADKKIREFKKGLRKRISIIFNILNFGKITGTMDFKTIKPKFTKNLPTLTSSELEDLKTIAQSGIKLSTKTQLDILPSKYVDNTDAELKRLKEEREDDENNLDYIPQVGEVLNG